MFLAKLKDGVFCDEIYQYLVTAAGTLSALSCGLHFGWPTPVLPHLLKEDADIPITSSEGSWLSVSNVLASTVSSILGCIITDKIGRKPTLLLTSPLYAISWLIIGHASSLPALISGRLIAGLADGLMFTSLPIYAGEIATPNIRGSLGIFLPAALALGLFLINVLGSYLCMKTAALVCLFAPVLHLITFSRAPESPYFLLMKNEVQRARTSLKLLRGRGDVEREIVAIQCAIEEQSKSKESRADLFRKKSNRKALFIIMGLYGMQYLSGSITITFYLQFIFQQAGKGISSATSSIVYMAINFLMACISAILVDRMGRKPILIVSALGCCICLAAEGAYFYFQSSVSYSVPWLCYVPVGFLIAYIILLNVGLGTIPLMMLGELFPTNVKALACCIANLYTCAVIVTSSKFFQIMNDHFGMYLPFFVFSSVCFFGIFFVIYFVPETKKKSLEQIQQYLNGQRA